MPFSAGSLLEVVEPLARRGATPAERRTIANRSYYAVYGVVRERLLSAKKTSPARLFGSQGRHRDIVDALARSGQQFRPIFVRLNGLLRARVRADYDYSGAGTPSDGKAISLFDSARECVELIGDLDDPAFKRVPFAPK